MDPLFLGILGPARCSWSTAFPPGASGIAEIGAVTLYRQLVPAYLLGIFVVLWRLTLYYLNIPLGLLAGVLAAKEGIGEGEADPYPTENL